MKKLQYGPCGLYCGTCGATDEQIDQLVYELYGLADEEIEIVEEATRAL